MLLDLEILPYQSKAFQSFKGGINNDVNNNLNGISTYGCYI